MVKLKLPRVKSQNVFLKHIEQDEWNDIQAYHIENESLWRFIALWAIFALMVVSGYAMYIVNKDQHKVVVFEKDSIGNITTLGLATNTLSIDNKMVAHQLANFIYALREVPSDIGQKRHSINIVHKMSTNKIRKQIDELLINQYAIAQNNQIRIEINRIIPLEGGKSWTIYWREEMINANNDVLKRQNWSSVVTFIKADTVDVATQLINPIGLFITYLHPVEDINNANME